MDLSWKELTIIDIIYALQFVLFMQWYYPKTINISGCTSPFIIYETVIGILQIATCYILVLYNVSKASKE